ncbi:MAG TPA: HEAT repeat domain-containing protein [Planctomycetota bacterium]|nr:HEAT repeat domain-containing protein [Planctomycetota bacterium]
MAPGVAGPNTPEEPPRAPGTNPGWGHPSFPPHPLLPGPGGFPSVYTVDDHEKVDDPGAWQLWWSFNKDPYLRYGRINTGQSNTLGGDFYLGKGERVRTIGGRASLATIQGKVVPGILAAMKDGGSNEFMRGALLALAKIGAEKSTRHIDFTLNWFLDGDNGNQLMNFTAPVALGILANKDSYEALAGLARDDEMGRKIYGRKVNDPMRAFATYGLGLIGTHTTDTNMRRRIVRDLIACLEDEGSDNSDLKVAAMTAMGLVPLEVVEDDMVCFCGTCKVADPDTSLGSQVTYLLRYFTSDGEYDATVRAHTATTLGRLIEAQPEGMSARLKEVVTQFLVDSLGKYAHQPDDVRRSAVLALGLIGDADRDKADVWIRNALTRSVRRGDPIEKRFALISLARSGARKGTGEDPFSGTASARKELLTALSKGKKEIRPWAALATGILGYHLRDEGGQMDPGVDNALRIALGRTKKPDEVGALALAVGLRGDREAAENLISQLEKAKTEDARSYASLGLGLTGDASAVEPLQDALGGASEEPLLASRSGLALGLLGDTEVVQALLDTLEDTEDESTRKSIVQALGYIGDERSIDALVAIMSDAHEDKEVRTQAVVALGYAADRAALNWRSKIASGVNYLAQSDMLTSSDGSGILDIE